MSLLLSIHSFPGANEALQRHWPRFLNVGADEVWVIGTIEGDCWHPAKTKLVKIGANSYIDSEHLPNRLLDTLEAMLKTDHEWLMIAEYDVLFFAPIDLDKATKPVAAVLTGVHRVGKFFHCPWAFHRDFAKDFIERGREIVKIGTCGYNTLESSPDVFFGLICDLLDQEVQEDLWTEFSRNSYDIPGHLEQAREAYRDGVDVIHGIKHEHELDFILS